jgi:hypothetical protein
MSGPVPTSTRNGHRRAPSAPTAAASAPARLDTRPGDPRPYSASQRLEAANRQRVADLGDERAAESPPDDLPAPGPSNGTRGIRAEELAERVARTTAPLPVGDLRSWLLERELAVDHDGRLEPTELGAQLGAYLS